MTGQDFRAIPGDPDGPRVEAMLDTHDGQPWYMTAPGDYSACAAEGFLADGTGHQEMVLMEWPARENHTDDYVTVRMAMHADDAIGLSEVLGHTGRWLRDHGLPAGRELGPEKARVEMAVTAILTEDAGAFGAAGQGLSAGEVAHVAGGASIVAGLFRALGESTGVSPSKLWRKHLAATSASREDL